MNTEKLSKLETFKLTSGSHESLENGACIMEMVSYFADEPWSDHPKCACPILTAYSIRLNDCFNDEHRQRLKEFIPVIVGTKGTDEIQIARKRLIRWRNVTATYPMILEVFKLPDLAKELRKFENTLESMAQAKAFLERNKNDIYKAAYANAYANAAAYANADANAYAYADADADADANANAYANAAADANANAYANADTNAYAYAYANANANANAAAYANANAYAAAAWRAKIADIAIETLRMAIAVTGKNQ
jgi:hypothetical protein